MAKKKFDSSKIIEMQENGNTIDEILQALNYKTESILKGQMTRAGYNLVEGRFIPKLVDQQKDQQQTIEPKAQDDNVNIKDDNNESLELILKSLKTIERHMLHDKYELHVSKENLKLKSFSIRVNEDDIDAFNKLCDNEYGHLTKSYLFSRALREFVEKYK